VTYNNLLQGFIYQNDEETIFEFTYSDKVKKFNIPGLLNKINQSSKLFPVFEELILENSDKVEKIKHDNKIKSKIEIFLFLNNIHGAFEFAKSDILVKKVINETINYKSVKQEILGDYTYPEILIGYEMRDVPDSSIVSNSALGLSGVQEKFAVIKDDQAKIIRYVKDDGAEYFIKPLNREVSGINKQLKYFKVQT